MTQAEEILMFNGITPPAPGMERTTCPVCSRHRKKSQLRCLRVHVGSWEVTWRCYHCNYFGGEALL